MFSSSEDWIIHFHKFVDGAYLTFLNRKMRKITLEKICREQTYSCTEHNCNKRFNWKAFNKVFELGLEGSHCEGNVKKQLRKKGQKH